MKVTFFWSTFSEIFENKTRKNVKMEYTSFYLFPFLELSIIFLKKIIVLIGFVSATFGFFLVPDVSHSRHWVLNKVASIFKYNFVNGKFAYLNKISPKYVGKGSIDNAINISSVYGLVLQATSRNLDKCWSSSQGSVCVCAKPMRDTVTM